MHNAVGTMRLSEDGGGGDGASRMRRSGRGGMNRRGGTKGCEECGNKDRSGC